MRKTILSVAAVLLLAVGCKNADQSSVIQLPVPPRAAGQTDMLQFAAPPIENVGIGVVGLGMRGGDAVQRLTFVPGCHVAAVCDVETDRAEKSLAYLKGKGLSANVYSGEEESYKALCEDPSVDLVYICTDWIQHVPVALSAMEHGKSTSCTAWRMRRRYPSADRRYLPSSLWRGRAHPDRSCRTLRYRHKACRCDPGR